MPFLTDTAKNDILSGALARQRVIDLDGIAVTMAIFHQRTCEPGELTTLHSHEYHEFTFIRSGAIRYDIEGERCSRTAGDTIFIPKGKKHSWTAGKGPVVLDGFMLSIAASIPACRPFIASLPSIAAALHYRMRSSHAKILTEIDREIAENAPYARKRIHALVTDIIYWLFRENFSDHLRTASAAAAPSAISRRETALYTKALAYITARINEAVTPAAVASELGFSARYVNRIFNRFAGMACGEHIREMKLARAYAMLAASSRTGIAEVAAAIGMRDVSYFTRLFHKRYGMSPRDMRDSI